MKQIIGIFSVMFLWITCVHASVSINNSDIPTMYKCCTNPAIFGNQRLQGCAGSYSNADIALWSFDAFSSPPVTQWSPDVAGVRVKDNGDIVVRFVIDDEDRNTFASQFHRTNTRIPYALEVEVVDYNQSFGSASSRDDYDVLHSSSMNDADVRRDLGGMMSISGDAKKIFEAIIYRPDLLTTNVVHEITFSPHQSVSGSIKLHMNFQLTVNYKYIQAMKENASNSCDFIDDIISNAYQNIGNRSDGWAKDLSVGDHGNDLPSDARDSWYYYAVQESDSSNPIAANSLSDVLSMKMCWDDGKEDNLNLSYDVTQGDDGVTHNESRGSLCGTLFDQSTGSQYVGQSNSDTCTTNSDGGQTCIIGSTTHIIHPNYRCSNNQCWQPGGETNCWEGNSWYEINNGNVSSIARYRDRNMCAEVYSADTLPVPEDPNAGNDDGYVDPVVNHTHAIGMHSVRYQLPGQDNYHYGTATVEQGTDQNLDIRVKVEEKEGWSWKNVCVDLYYSDNHWFIRSHDQLIDTKCFDSLAPNASESKYFENLALKDLDQGHHYFFADIRYGYDHNISSNEDDSEYVVVDVVKPNGIPNGFIDTASCSSVDGWASDPDTASPLNVHIYKSNTDGSNKTFVTGILADRYRADVGTHSFSWAIPESLKTGNAYTLYFYAINQSEGNNPLIGQKNILCANPAASLLPAYRLFNTSVSTHFYTISEAEKNSILQNYVWRAEGVAFYAHYKLEQYAVPIYRFNQRGRGHFYTASDAEKNSLMSNTAWTYEGVVFFAYTWQVAGSKPVYRMYSAQRMAHFYTTSWQEVQSAGASGYAYEGIGFYAF